MNRFKKFKLTLLVLTLFLISFLKMEILGYSSWAKIKNYIGNIYVLKQGTLQSINDNMRLSPPFSIITSNGRLELYFNDGNTIKVDQYTYLEVEEQQKEEYKSFLRQTYIKRNINLSYGKIWFDFQAVPLTTNLISTGSITVKLSNQESKGFATYDNENGLIVELIKGSAVIVNSKDNKTYKLTAGKKFTFAKSSVALIQEYKGNEKSIPIPDRVEKLPKMNPEKVEKFSKVIPDELQEKLKEKGNDKDEQNPAVPVLPWENPPDPASPWEP